MMRAARRCPRGAVAALPIVAGAVSTQPTLQRRWAMPGQVSGQGTGIANVASRGAFKEANRHEHLLGENPPFFSIDEPAYQLSDESLFIDRKAFGIPFLVDDDAALDAAFRHHQTAVDVLTVERVLLPFWLATASIGGSFRSEVWVRDNTTMAEQYRWHEVPDYQFSYPYEEHNHFNQICATYDPVAAFAEEVCAGSHVPSMLISRFELLQELEEMEAMPRFVPFQLSTKSAVKELETRVDRAMLERTAKKELRKYHGNFTHCNIRFFSMVAEITRVRPVFLPLYCMTVATQSHKHPLPFFVCGATGRAKGPVIHQTPYKQAAINGVAGTVALVAGALTTGALAAAGAAVAASTVASQVEKMRLTAKATAVSEAKRKALRNREARLTSTDETGYRWTVEDEETMEYSYREELRAKARRRAEFEQRVREESQQEEARATGRKFKARSRARRRPGTLDRDPLGYYEVLGFKGQEEKATSKDISKAFRQEAQKHHPDMVPPELQDVAKAKMQRLVEAYSVLRDAKLRKEYDDGALTRPGAEADADA